MSLRVSLEIIGLRRFVCSCDCSCSATCDCQTLGQQRTGICIFIWWLGSARQDKAARNEGILRVFRCAPRGRHRHSHWLFLRRPLDTLAWPSFLVSSSAAPFSRAVRKHVIHSADLHSLYLVFNRRVALYSRFRNPPFAIRKFAIFAAQTCARSLLHVYLFYACSTP